jgi:hypothetical protein
MRVFNPTRNVIRRTVGAGVLTMVLATSVLAGAAVPAAAGPAAPTKAALEVWQTKVGQVPQVRGCSTASYPSLAWRGTPCTFEQNPPMTPRPPGPRPRPWPLTVGSASGDLSAVAPSGHISSATGSFDSVSGVTSETSPAPSGGSGVADNYTLQLNTDTFSTSACAASPNPGCRGWEQFVYWNTGTSGRMFIQYWLMYYNAPCPVGGGWTFFQFNPGDAVSYCYRNNSGQLSGLTNQPVTNLANLRVVGNATAGSDSMTLFVGGSASNMSGDNSLSASGGWTIAEFNVFGGPGGQNATFNSGASIKARTRISYGGDAPPGCSAQSFTGETTNLGFGTPAPTPTAPGPSIQFIEDTAHSTPANCAYAAAIGDTHQRTVAGLLYDFQAAGDFVEAQIGRDFEVQTRKVSGAPTWPNASVNQSVAARVGRTQVALCDGRQLMIDGRPAEVADGKSLWVPTGVDIGRLGNTYFIIDQAGNSVRVAVNSGHLDVSVGLGAYPVRVRGLLGNPDGDVTRLEARDDTQFKVPVPFQELYSRYGDSWRLDPATSLLSVCGRQTEQSNPGKPFFARDLDQDQRERALAICREAKVHEAWLEACTLDVAVLGERATAGYVDAQTPILTNP